MNGGHTIRSFRVLPVLMALAALAPAHPAAASLLEFQAQTQYDFLQVKRRGESATGSGRFSTNYNLTLRRPFLPTSTLMSDLSFTSTDIGDINTRQNTRGWILNLYSNDPKYMLSGRVSHSTYGSSSDLLASASGYTRDYNASLFLRQPSYPVVNLQFQRNTSGSSYAGFSGGYTTTSWLMSSAYDLKPLRFTMDRVRQSFGYSGGGDIKMNRQSSAVTMNHPLMPGLSLQGELSKSTTRTSGESNDTATDISRRVIRLTATPLRSVVANVALSSLTTDQSLGAIKGHNRDSAISWGVRSEILPGLSMDYEDQKQSLSATEYFGSRDSASRNRNFSLAARLAESSIFNVTRTVSTYDVESVSYFSKQDTLQSALQTALTRTTDLSVAHGRTKSTTGAGSLYDTTTDSISLRDRTSPRLSLGATIRRTKLHSEATGGEPFHQTGNAFDVDALWQPNYDIGINARLSFQDNRGDGAYRAIAPSANVRWQIDSSTHMTASYSLQRFEQYNAAQAVSFGQDTRGLNVRVTHNLPNGSNVDVSYGFQGNSIADTEWRRQLRVSYTMVR